MDGFDSHGTGGRLQISTEVIEKIARLAAMEVDGVVDVRPAALGPKNFMDKIAQPKAIRVDVKNDVADIEVSLAVRFGSKIPELSERVQHNVKDSVQNMTSISVAKVDVVIIGVEEEAVPEEAQ